MITSSGRSGGGGGGSHRDVIFTAKIVADPKNAQVLGGMSKQIEDMQRKMSNIGVGGRAGGVRGSGRPGVGGAGTSQLDKDFADLDRKLNNFDRQMNQHEAERERTARGMKRDAAELKRNWKDVADGVIGVSRAFVLMGAASEESLDKLVRKLAVFEGAVAGVKGAQKLAGGIAGLTGLSSSAVAGIGVGLGGAALLGLGIREQLQGREGPIARGTSRSVTGLYRTLADWGFHDEASLTNYDTASGLYNPYARLAGSQLRGERMFGATANRTAGDLRSNQTDLIREQGRLNDLMRMRSAMDTLGMDARDERERAALGYFSLNPRERKQALQARGRFLDDPTKASEQDIFSAVPFLDRAGQARARGEFARRAQGEGVYGRGFEDNATRGLYAATGQAIADLKLPQQREVVLKLTEENERLLSKWKDIMSRALEEVDEANAAKLQAITDELMQQRRQIEVNRQGTFGATSNSFGFSN